MNFKKAMALVITLSMILCVMPFFAFAADPQVTVIDGERTVFLGTFGKVSYNGKSNVSFRTFPEALNALGKDGGRIVLSGNISVGEFDDIPGRNKVTIVGIGANSAGNCISFAGNSEICLEGDVALGNVNIRTDAGAVIITNGHKFETFDNFDTYHVETYVADGPNVITYPDPPSIAVGKAEGDSALKISDGTYSNIIAGAANSKTVNGSTLVVIDGSNVDIAVAGNFTAGTTNGSTELEINDGNIKKLIAGSDSGVVNGNVTVTINGGTIGELVVGSNEGATINGNLVLAVNGSSIEAVTSGSGKVTGKIVVIKSSDVEFENATDFADYVIEVSGGICEAVFENSDVKGFKFTDTYGIPVNEITINGQKTAASEGIFNLNIGASKVEVTSVVTLDFKKNAVFVNGYEDGTFRPQNNMTRAEAVTLLSRLIVDDSYIKEIISSDFADVESGAWYESYIGFFEKQGFLDLIARDYGLKFAPTENITRGEFTQLIYEISSITTDSPSVKLKYFSDVDSSNIYAAAINFAVSANIVNGYEDGTFKPDNEITRAEVVTMVNRLLGRIPTGVAGENSFSDISSHWANSQILAACNAENVSWTPSTAEAKYVLTGSSAEEYVKALYDQSATLSSEAIREGVDVVSDKIKQDILSATDNLDLTGKKIIYVSEKNGDDANDGLTPETALKTIAGISQIKFLRNAAVLFERGGVYRGQIVCAPNTYYGAYGVGNKPILMQSKRNYADESLWVETEYPNVYKCTELLTNVGVIGFDHDIQDYSDASYDETYGLIMNKDILGFTGVTDMNKDLQFYSEFVNNDINIACNLYVYSTEGNPGKRFSSIEIGEKFDIIDGTPTNVTVDNLSFKFTGAHAIGVGNATRFKVENCVFSWLGGSVLSLNFGTSNKPVNYGNAVETGICNGYYVENNWMYQIYDTGPTHQVSAGEGRYTQRDVRYIGNLIEYVHWGIEFYNNASKNKDISERYTDGVYTAYNICRYGGYGWGSIVRNRQTGAQLYCGASLGVNKNQLTEYNIFDRCAGQLINLCAESTEVDDKNIYIQTIGKQLGNLKNEMFVKCDYDSARNIKKYFGDENAVVIVIDPEKEDPAQYNK